MKCPIKKPLVPKLQLGNSVLEAPASRLAKLCSRRYAQCVQARHSGMDAGQIRQERICINPGGVQGRIALHESSAMDGNLAAAQVLD